RLLIDDRAEEMNLLDSVQNVAPDQETLRLLHQTIQKVSEDLEEMRFNTAIAAMMEFTNHLTKLTVRPRSALQTFVLLLSPFAPHGGEEPGPPLGTQSPRAYDPGPISAPARAKKAQIGVRAQANGKPRARLTIPAECTEAQLKELALADDKVKTALEGK